MNELYSCGAYWLLRTVYTHGILKVNKFLKMNTTTIVLLVFRAQRCPQKILQGEGSNCRHGKLYTGIKKDFRCTV